MKRIIIASFALAYVTTAAAAVTVWEIRRNCGSDGKSYCAKAGYGEPMKACLNQNFTKLTPQCKAIMKRINAGEKVKLF